MQCNQRISGNIASGSMAASGGGGIISSANNAHS